MATAVFDTLKASDALIDAGVEPKQARVIVATMRDAVTENVATKADLAELGAALKDDIGAVRTKLKDDIGAVRTELKDDIGAVKTELKDDLAVVKADVAALRAEMSILKWVLGFIALILVAMTARVYGIL